ncbi:MAG: hypothetical protein ABR526_08825 [Chthoniobacterales bacterium]
MVSDIVWEETLRKERTRKRLKREAKKAAKAASARPPNYTATPPLLKFLRENFRGTNRLKYLNGERRWIITIPKVFSLTENPEESLDTIYSLLQIPRRHKARQVWFDHRACQHMDLGASALLDVCVMNLRTEQLHRRHGYTFGGEFPKDEHVGNILRCMGITKHLEVPGAEPPDSFDKTLVKFNLFRGHRNHSSPARGGSDQERASTELALHLDKCLRRAARRRLTPEAMSLIGNWAGEIITNAEEHSGKDMWFAIGYMEPPPIVAIDSTGEASTASECQLTIFNFGNTIHDTLTAPKTPDGTKADIGRLVDIHNRKNFFGASERFTEPDLWTLYALQDGVSRFNEAPGSDDRGRGTVNMIHVCQTLGRSNDATKQPIMTLVSGSTRIVFDGTYPMRWKAFPEGARRIIAFNQHNDLEEKPDGKCVHSVSGRFPGTILTFKFFIDNMYQDLVEQ